MSLSELLEQRRLLVFVGPGGVGKTTLGAAVAIEAAARGRRVAVITIDPARRLADALGLDGLDDELRPVAGIAPPGTLHAAMLDTKSSYDRLIGRITDDPDERRAILDNRVYQSFSRTLARSHAYVAMERLHAVMQTGEHDLVVLDTPPTRSALDILDAPGRLASFLDERVLGAFLGTPSGGAAAWLRAKGTEVALRLFGTLVGDDLMGELAGFFEVFFHLRHGFAERAATVQEWLRHPRTAFVLVTAPDRTHLADAAYLRDGLLARKAPLEALLFNRTHHPAPDGRPLCEGAWDPNEAVARWPDGDKDVLAEAAALRAERVEENRERDRLTADFALSAGPRVHVCRRLPRLPTEPTSVEQLRALLRAPRPNQGG